MTSAFLFWLLMLFWLIFGGAGYLGPAERRGFFLGGFNLLLFLLLALLGWKLFGQPLKG